MMWKDKQAGQSKPGKRGCRGTKGCGSAAVPQAPCLTQDMKLADVPLRFWALNYERQKCL